MDIPFVKYQGTGNDFVIIDQRNTTFLMKENVREIAKICDRRFGVGADGLMLLEKTDGYSFRMVYFNADGRESTMCGNGGRCMAHYAASLGLFEGTTAFLAIDGPHETEVVRDWVKLKMCDVPQIHVINENAFTLFTGSPHYVQWVEKIPADVKKTGSGIRYSEPYAEEGINVNFVLYHEKNNMAEVATYERGVEDETLSCGTGVTAAALVCASVKNASSPVSVQTKGGGLEVYFHRKNDRFTDVWLAGPATFVFSGLISL
jgi:diaminopimelate epimerase